MRNNCMRLVLIIFSLFVLFSCKEKPSPGQTGGNDPAVTSGSDTMNKQPQTETKDFLIMPGEKIGELNIGDNAAVNESKLGKPDFSDAAMGKAWLTWNGKPDEHNNPTQLNVYTTYADTTMSAKTVQLIRTTSSAFSTADNSVRVYADLATIGKKFPALKYVGHFKEKGTERIMSIYNDTSKGIAFEIAVVGEQKICTGIIIYDTRKKLMDIYQGFLNANNWERANQK